MRIAAVLSDLDGVLVDSWAVIGRTWRRWADSRGLDAHEVLVAAATLGFRFQPCS